MQYTFVPLAYVPKALTKIISVLLDQLFPGYNTWKEVFPLPIPFDKCLRGLVICERLSEAINTGRRPALAGSGLRLLQGWMQHDYLHI